MTETFEQAQDILAAALPGYERRPQQMQLGALVEAGFKNPDNYPTYITDENGDLVADRFTPQHVLGQAGTGTGKSLGYLIPAILSGRRVLVSVTTKALQEQLIAKDLPFLQEHLDVAFTFSILKGRSNYLCLDRLRASGEDRYISDLLKLSKDPDFTGMQEECGDIPAQVWQNICSNTDECSGCDTDYATLARARAQSSDIVVINHALLCSDLFLQSKGIDSMMGECDSIVLDECHMLEEVAGSSLTESLSEGAFSHFSSELRNWAAQNTREGAEGITNECVDVEQAARQMFSVLSVGRIKLAGIAEVANEVGDLHDSLLRLQEAVKGLNKIDGIDERSQKQGLRLRRTLASHLNTLLSFVASPENEIVRWIEEKETRRGRRKYLNLAPIDVSPFLRANLFSKTFCVLVSATMKIGGNFNYLAGRLGIDNFSSVDVGTPFNYAKQARLYVPIRLPEPIGGMQQAWQQLANDEICRLIELTKGRALVLFTSINHMKQAADVARQKTTIDIKMQGDLPHADMVDWLKDDSSPKAIFAVKSFFTGVDISGEALSNVILVKMPFPVPNEPLTEARTEAIEARGKSGFFDYSVPVMSLEMQQALGRLIRHTSDSGVCAVLDPRIITKSYGKRILKDLPPMPLVHELDAVEAFLGKG